MSSDEDTGTFHKQAPPPDAAEPIQKKSRKKKPISEKNLAQHKVDHENRGIVYMSSIPPMMKANKIRTLLSQKGAEVLRIYLAPEDPLNAKRRREKGGKRGKRFIEGWIEFANKKEAKRLARTLNGQHVGGKHFSKHYYDLWTLKYLKGFMWDHLTEDIAYQNAVRQHKLDAELRTARKDRDFYLSRVDKAKALDAMEERNKGKRAKEAE
eukprot:CAMPEP_0198212446 /NCGR_PEP_ID=MMETSP1445-20131203/26101_1 /TAXON_ID=36898 /ORGANISM="Pyramimonas sp., Strain CCMP2087" /LENGTH=209 /DNA_ID=CAMNT_0043886893 /DNA_START=397 /DNA_END=1023 /DNA_ORIENTATION=-